LYLPDSARWALTHGLIRLAQRREAAKGNPATRRITDPKVRLNPYAHYDTMRSDDPFVAGLASKMTVRHEVANEVLRSDAMGVATFGGAPGPIRRILAASAPSAARSVYEPPSMVAVDPPYHSRYRKLVVRAFSAKAVNALRIRTEEVAARLLDGMAGRDPRQPVDVVKAYASQLPAVVICEMLGAPTDMSDQFLAWSDAAASPLDPGMSRKQFLADQREIDALLDWLRGHFEHLRRHPGQDIMSDLVNSADTDGRRLTESELLATTMLVLAAGLETTVNLMANGIALLEQHADQRALLAQRPDLWPNAIDEMLRSETPVQRISRRALRDTRIGGVELTQGEIVVVMIGAANRDPEVFTDPATFDVTRANAGKHLAFGSGIHYCLGAALAKMEAEVGFRALYDRFPGLRLLDEGERKPTRNLRGFNRLTASLDPTPVH
jgi:cytochrome P450